MIQVQTLTICHLLCKIGKAIFLPRFQYPQLWEERTGWDLLRSHLEPFLLGFFISLRPLCHTSWCANHHTKEQKGGTCCVLCLGTVMVNARATPETGQSDQNCHHSASNWFVSYLINQHVLNLILRETSLPCILNLSPFLSKTVRQAQESMYNFLKKPAKVPLLATRRIRQRRLSWTRHLEQVNYQAMQFCFHLVIFQKCQSHCKSPNSFWSEQLH